MASYNQAMKTIAAFLGIRHGEYSAVFDRLALEEPLAKSRIKSWFCSYQDNKYRKADRGVFLNFCKAVHMHTRDGAAPSFAENDSIGDILDACFAGFIHNVPLTAIKELVSIGTEDPGDRQSMYSRSLHLLCMAYLDAESLQGGFATTREVANQRFAGVLWTVCETGRRIDGASFSMDSFEDWCKSSVLSFVA